MGGGMKNRDTKFILLALFVVIVSSIATYFFHEKIRYNKDLLNFTANIFSILTGFLLLVITVSGDVATLQSPRKRSQSYSVKNTFDIRFGRYMMLFFIYLSVLCLIFLYYLTMPSGDLSKLINSEPSRLSYWLEIAICWLSITAFFSSFFIPMRIKQLYKEKMESK